MKSVGVWWRVGLSGLVFLLAAKPVCAHPMGNFSINHYTRLEVNGDRLTGRYVLDVAEIPTVSEMERLDADHDGKVSDVERATYLKAQAVPLGRALSLTVNGRSVLLNALPDSVELRPGAGGLPTLRLTLALNAVLPAAGNTPRLVEYKDQNFPLRTGWKEIVVTGQGGSIRDSTVSTSDISKELTTYPTDPGIAPPQTIEARFTVVEAQNTREEKKKRKEEEKREADAIQHSKPKIQNVNTPQDKFTQSIAAQGLTPAVILLSLTSAFLFGALHALSPGHGKAMVAAYLVGTRGTAWHAVLLGLVVTLTHTLGVFALGLLTLSASRYIVPERLYPLISGASGAAVAMMGLGLLASRLSAWRRSRTGAQDDNEEEESGGNGDEEAADEFRYQRREAGTVSLRTLIGLGITGGALPCPSALVVMLSAIALHRIAFGLLLIVSFSMGLAVVLTLLGLLVMRARGILERVPSRGSWMAGLSVVSAGVVTAIGLALFVRALSGGF
jgi:nickel/cobalt exporter